MPTRWSVSDYIDAIAMGTGKNSSQLEYAVLKILSFEDCQYAYVSVPWNDALICAYDSVNHQSTAQGDSGGPLISSQDGSLIGISNFVSLGIDDIFCFENGFELT